MKFLKLLSAVVLSAVVTSAFAANTAKAYLTFSTVGGEQVYSDDVKLFEDDADILNTEDIYNSISDYCVNAYAVYENANYSKVKIASLENLVIKFIANNHNTNYNLSFSNVSGTEYFLQKGDDTDPANWIPMTADYPFTCELNEEITFTVVKEAPVPPVYADYSRENLTINQWYTICLPEASVSFSGMDLYEVAGYVDGQGLAVDPVEGQMEAGMPYIFLATAEEISVFYVEEGEVKEEPVDGANHLIGTFVNMTTPAVAYVVANNMLNWAAAGTDVPANRAYLAVEDITTLDAPAVSAPGRKFIAPKAMPTDLNEVAAGMADGTYMINGQVVLVKDGKTFNVLGF